MDLNLTLFENLALAYSRELNRKHKLLPMNFLPKEFKKEIDEILSDLDLLEKKNVTSLSSYSYLLGGLAAT